MKLDESFNNLPGSLFKLADNYFVCAYRGGITGNQGWLKTFHVDAEGNIKIVDVFPFSEEAAHCSVSRFLDDIFVVTYKGQVDNRGYMFTIQISNSGIINGLKLDEWLFDYDFCYFPSVTLVSEGMLTITYIGGDRGGYVKTFMVGSDGIINKSWHSSFQYTSEPTYYNQILKVNQNMFAIAYTTGDYSVVTVEINPVSGSVDHIVDSLSLGIPGYSVIHFFSLSPPYYGLCYTGMSDCRLATFHVDNDGFIEVMDDKVIDSGEGKYPYALPIDDVHNAYLFVSSSASDATYIRGRTVTETGVIGEEWGSHQIANQYSRYHILAQVNGDLYIILYQDDTNKHGWIKSFIAAQEYLMPVFEFKGKCYDVNNNEIDEFTGWVEAGK